MPNRLLATIEFEHRKVNRHDTRVLCSRSELPCGHGGGRRRHTMADALITTGEDVAKRLIAAILCFYVTANAAAARQTG